VKLLSPLAILQRLDRRLPLLTGGARDLPERQRTLRAAIGWSYDLLSRSEQTLFAGFSVFVGGATFDAAEAVLGSDYERGFLLDELGSLVDRSMLRRGEGPEGEPRFWMLETLREYALDRLEARGEAEPLRRRHAFYFLDG